MTIVAAGSWASNAHLIEDVAALGYLDRNWLILDPTYGRGNWWTRLDPLGLVAHDIALDGVDFRDLPELSDTFDAVAFDPPYVSVGGRETSGIGEMLERYGMTDAPRTPAALQAMIDDGLLECARVLKPRGFLLVKCADYISSGRYFPGTHYTLTRALTFGLEIVDRFEHVGRPRAQPPGRRQVHARRNLSTLLVLRRPS